MGKKLVCIIVGLIFAVNLMIPSAFAEPGEEILSPETSCDGVAADLEEAPDPAIDSVEASDPAANMEEAPAPAPDPEELPAPAAELEESPGSAPDLAESPDSGNEETLNEAISIAYATIEGLKPVYRVEDVNGVRYIDGKKQDTLTLSFTVKYKNATLRHITDYTTAIDLHDYYGTGSLTIYGQGKFTGSKTVLFKWSHLTTLSGSGSDGRYQTAARIVNDFYDEGSTFNEVVLVKGTDFPDALAANAYAGSIVAPLLLTRAGSIPQDIKIFLSTYKNKIKTITFIGKGMEGAQAEAKKLIPSAKIQEIGGNDRYETAEKVCEKLFEVWASPDYESSGRPIDTVFLVYGRKAADALSASPWSYLYEYPILLTNSQGLATEKTKALLKNEKFKRVIVLGQEEQVRSSNVKGVNSQRIAGDDRYATSRALIDYMMPQYKKDFIYDDSFEDAVVVASGRNANFPDALTGGQLRYPLVLVDDSHTDIPASIKNLLPVSSQSQMYYYMVGAAGKGQGTMYEKVAKGIEGS